MKTAKLIGSSLYLFLFFLIVGFNVQAKIIKDICITKISDILEHVPKDGNAIVVFDWDRTISSQEGNEAMRESQPDTGTLAVINQLHKKNIKTLILTARFNGLGLAGDSNISAKDFKKLLENKVALMKNALASVRSSDNGPLVENALTEIPLGDDKVLLVDQFVFAGGEEGKGKALALLIDNNKFKTQPDVFVFIDNSSVKLSEMRDAFSSRPENVYLFHYPRPTNLKWLDKITGDVACPIKR